MFYVYLLRSITFPQITYIGYTEDIDSRINNHNAGLSFHTAKYKPWTLELFLAFKSQSQAKYFEKYLKSGSGRTFAKRHLWQ